MAGVWPPRLRQVDLEVTPTAPPSRPLAVAARLLNEGQPEDAARLCLEIVSEKPEATVAWRLLGNARVAQMRYPDAIRCYRRVLDLAPESAEANNNLGAAHQLQGELKRAADCFRRAIVLKPDYAQAHCNLGVALRKLGRLDDAIACQHRAIEIAPDYAKAHYNLGNALKEGSERDASIHAYRQAIAHDPGHAEAHNNLGTVLEGQGHTAQALGEFSRAMTLDDTYVEAHYNHALLHCFQAGDPAIDKLLQLDSQESENRRNKNRLAFALAKARADLGEYDAAFAHYVQANAVRRQRSNYDKSAMEQEVKTSSPLVKIVQRSFRRQKRKAHPFRFSSLAYRAAEKAWSNHCSPAMPMSLPPARASTGNVFDATPCKMGRIRSHRRTLARHTAKRCAASRERRSFL